MERFLKSTLKAVLPCLFLLFSAQSFAAEVFKLDPNHSYVLWSVDHIGYSEVNGKIFAEGTITLEGNKPQFSKVDVSLNLSSMSTGVKKLDEELATKDYFDVAQFPNATFKSDKITVTGKNTARVHGMLTIRGITKPLVLNAILRKHEMHPMMKKMAIGFSATGTLKRSDFGLKAYVPAVSDKVSFTLVGEALVENQQ